jgi:drug/metabolite transporter (DMT)-like permease
MKSPQSPTSGIHDRPLAGIVHMIGGAFALSGIDLVSKFVVAEMSAVQMLALRAVFVMLILAPFFRREGGLALFRTRRLAGHALRFGCMFVSVICFFEALRVLPLAMVVALGFTAPIFITALSMPMLREAVGARRWAAVVLGFCGTLVVVNPAAGSFSAVAILPVVAALGWAVGQVMVRRLATTESDGTIMLYLNTGMALGLGAIAPFFWSPASPGAFALCFVLGGFMVAAQWLIMRAVRLAPVAVVTPFQYLELPLAVAFGWLLWNEWPGTHVFAGAAMIVASGLFVAWNERQRVLAARRAAA